MENANIKNRHILILLTLICVYMIWVMICDIDEFLFLSENHGNIKLYLEYIQQKCPDAKCIRVNWKIYGDDGKYNDDISIPVYKRIVKPHTKSKLNYLAKSLIHRSLFNKISF